MTIFNSPLRTAGALFTLIFVQFTSHSSPSALAGADSSCHFHGKKTAEEKVIIQCATKRKEALIKKGKIDPSWQSVEHSEVTQVDGKKGKEWKVTFKNPTEADKKKENLYMFFTLIGNFVAANFSGN
ncbi:MAG: hypothetical protein RJB13_654 [Pseudomonadota bacterium]